MGMDGCQRRDEVAEACAMTEGLDADASVEVEEDEEECGGDGWGFGRGEPMKARMSGGGGVVERGRNAEALDVEMFVAFSQVRCACVANVLLICC